MTKTKFPEKYNRNGLYVFKTYMYRKQYHKSFFFEKHRRFKGLVSLKLLKYKKKQIKSNIPVEY